MVSLSFRTSEMRHFVLMDVLDVQMKNLCAYRIVECPHFRDYSVQLLIRMQVPLVPGL